MTQLAFPLPGCAQRWRAGRAAYRVPGTCINPLDYDVVALSRDAVAKAFVTLHHYAHSYPAARFRFGLYRAGRLVGVAVFSHPCHDQVLLSVFPGVATDSVELGRFVLLDEVPHNGETWFLARCFEQLTACGIIGVVSHCDPVARASAHGDVVFPGHIGTIYQAHNARYLGRARPKSLRVLPDGTVFSRRAEQKLLSRSRGWRYAAATLERFGADAPGQDLRVWLLHWRSSLTRPLRHPGNHKYAWALSRAAAGAMPAAQPYPKDCPSGEALPFR